MKLIVCVLSWLLIPLAALVIAFDVAKTYVEHKMLPEVE